MSQQRFDPRTVEPVAVTVRNGAEESLHHGMAVALDATGSLRWAVGDPTVAVYPRSANKPMQAVAMLRAGLRVSDEQLALVCASHDGTPDHLAVVRRILSAAQLREHDLATTPDLPLDEAAAHELLRHGGGPTAVQMNCSGKHSGMLATCVVNGWPTATYLHPDHPLQQAITDTITELGGEAPADIGIDGCGAPAHRLSLVALARAVGRIASGAAGAEGRAVFRAMTTYPQLVGGARRDVTVVMRSVPGLLAKDGAEGVFVAALADGRAAAVKIADGAGRAAPLLLLAALDVLGVDTASASAVESLSHPVLGHGRPVGRVRVLDGIGRTR